MYMYMYTRTLYVCNKRKNTALNNMRLRSLQMGEKLAADKRGRGLWQQRLYMYNVTAQRHAALPVVVTTF